MSGAHAGQADKWIIADGAKRLQAHVAASCGPLDGMDHPIPEPGLEWAIFHQPEEASMSTVVTIGLDLAKSVFQIHGVDDAGKAVLRRRLSRHELVLYFSKLPGCLVGMEACSGAHFIATAIRSQGHEVRLIARRGQQPRRSVAAVWSGEGG